MSFFAKIRNKEKYGIVETFYKEHASWMYKVAYSILSDEHLAQDAVQEAFLNIANNIEKIIESDCNKIKALFVIIVRNAAIDIYRRRKKQNDVSFEEIEEALFEPEPTVEEILINNENLTILIEKIKELYPSYTDILSLKFFYHYEDEEISRLLNITPENVRTRLHRARKSLLKLLSQRQEGKS